MKKLLFGLCALVTVFQVQSQTVDLFFSEYIEGSSNNKALEIYNPTGSSVNLSNYTIYRFNNGATSASGNHPMNGMLASGAVRVVANPSAISSISSVADTTSTITFFNGDDAIALVNTVTGDTTDIIGKVGEDPGTNWPVGSGATSEFTLVRMPSVSSGTTDWSVGANQWIVLPQNTADSLGAHSYTVNSQSSGILYFEDFEANDGGWTAGGSNSSWGHGAPAASFITGAPACGMNAWVTNLTGSYNNSEDSHITSPLFDFSTLTNDPILRFDHIYETEGCCDEGWVEYSIDNGATWTKLGTAGSGLSNWYNDSGNDWWDGNSGASGQWRIASHVLTGLAGEDSVRVRFAFDSDGSVTRDGFGVDNILIFSSLNDAVAQEIITPAGSQSFGSTEVVSASFANSGTDTITSIQVCYTLNGGTPVCETFAVNVLPTGVDTVNFTQTVDLSAVGTYDFVVYTSLAGDGFVCNDTISAQASSLPYITSFPYIEDFETSNGSWSTTGSNSSWAYGIPAAAFITGSTGCGSNAWVTNLTGDYNNSENSSLISPMMDFSGMTNNPVLRFDHIFETEGCCDEGWVEYSTDGGATWTKLGTAASGLGNWYNDSGNDWWDGTSGNTGEWRIAAHQLTGLAGEDSVRIQFVFSSDGSVTRDGFGVDNIFIFENVDDVSIAELINPVGSQAFTSAETVTASFQNLSNVTITSIDLCYVLNNGTPVCETFTVNVPPTGIDTVSFVQTMDISAVTNHNIVVYTNWTADSYNCNDTLSAQVTTIASGLTSFPYVEDFEANDGGWTTGGSNSSWAYGVPAGTEISSASGCGSSAWVTNLTGDYNNSENSFITSPLFDFSGLTNDPVLKFDHIYETEGCCDEGWVEYSTNGGVTWVKLGTSTSGIINWYNDAGNDWWDGTSGSPINWRVAAHQLTGLAGESSVRIRFNFSSDGSVVREGFGVDNVVISEGVIEDISLAADSLSSPVGGCAGSSAETVTVLINNMGVDTITSLPVCYTVNGGTAVCETITTSIAPGDSQLVSFVQTVNLSSAGTYTIEIYGNSTNDLFMCNDTATFTVQIAAPIVSSVAIDSNVSCNGLADGAATASVTTGGTMPYSFSWSNNDSTSAINGLSAGVYVVTITDANGCSTQDTATITEPAAVTFTLQADTINCFAAATGSVTIDGSIMGGTAPFTYLWSDGSTADSISGITAGSYSLVVTDANGCTATQSIVVEQNDSLSIQLAVTNVTCEGGNDGSIAATVSGGTPNYAYNWTGGATTSTASNLVAGTYDVTVTDALSCGRIATATLSFDNALPQVDLGADTAVGPGFEVTLNSGFTAASNLWSTNETTESISVEVTQDTTIWVEVTTPEGCTGSDTIVIGVLLSNNDVVENASIRMYPNPTRDLLNVTVENVQAEQVLIQVLNLNGQVLLEERVNDVASNNNTELNLGNLSSGVYFVNVLIDGNRHMQKITVN